MSFSNPLELATLLGALAVLLACAHGTGFLFRKLHQPQVIGEIVGGIVLGPTVLGALFPGYQQSLFSGNLPIWTVLGMFYQFGLMLLMFSSGMEIRTNFQSSELRTPMYLTVVGIVIPVAIALILFQFVPAGKFIGTAHDTTAFILIFAIATAVTSIPVISRIFHDLKIIDTEFAGIVLTAAVIEDIVLYVILSIAVSLVGESSGALSGLPALIGLQGGTAGSLIYHICASLIFFSLLVFIGPPLLRKLRTFRFFNESNPATLLILFLFIIVGIGILLGIAPMLGAFVAGIIASRVGSDNSGSRFSIKTFSYAFPIPIYFAIVGLRLNLLQSFDPVFFIVFLLFACLVKAASTYLGARLAGEKTWGSLNFGIAMNARGGPGIVLASTALDAGIINENFYAILVILAIVTSCVTGWWIGLVVRRKWPLR